MSGEVPTISSQNAIWEMIPAEAREDWAVQQAARVEFVRDAARLFIMFDGSEGQAIKDDIKVELEPLLVRFGHVPPHRCEEVFELAETALWQEMDADGQA